jgi:HK97 family phage major capsid protein
MNLRELLEKRAGIVAAMTAIDTAGAGRELTVDERAEWDRLDGEYKTLSGQIERAQLLESRRASQTQSMGQVVGAQGGGGAEQRQAPGQLRIPRGDDETRAMAHYIRTNDAGALGEARASNNTGMNYGTAADGGNAVPTGHFQQIIARRDEQMLAKKLRVRQIAGVGTTVNVPIDDEADGEFVTKGEMGDDNSTNVFDRDAPAIGTVAMTLVKKTKKIEITDELLADEDSNLLRFIEEFIGRGVAKTHNDMLVTEALANGTAALTLDSATTIGAGEVPELWYLLPDYYATDEPSVGWVMRRSTEGIVRGLAGTTNFYYAPTPGGEVGMRPMLWGAPLYNTGKMAASAASAKSLLLGNFYFMGLREAPSMSFLRDPYTVDGKVILKYYFRCVYKVLQASAIIYATHPSA